MLTPNEIADYSTDLLAYSKYIFRNNHSGEFVENWHHRKICEALEKVFIGQSKRLIINIPPRYSKTELAVINFATWALGIYPDCEFIHTSYSKTLAAKNAYYARSIIGSEAYKRLFSTELKDDSKAKDEWKTTQGGVFYAAGTDGTITGYGAGKLREGFGGALIIDDPHKANEAKSSTIRGNVIEWFQSTIESRLNSPETPIILIMQRLHEMDLAGWLLDGGNGENWDSLILPAIGDSGEPLWPYKHSVSKLREMEAVNAYQFAAQYMQRPAPKGGGLIKEEWLSQTYKALPRGCQIIQSWDTAYKASQLNDPSCCTTWAWDEKGIYLIDVFVKRMQYPELKRAVSDKYNQFKPSAVLIEDKASGQSLIQEFKASTRIPVIPITPDGDKETRMSEQTPSFESANVYLKDNSDWAAAYKGELTTFPMGAHDDQVDSTSQALRYINRPRKKATQRPLGLL